MLVSRLIVQLVTPDALSKHTHDGASPLTYRFLMWYLTKQQTDNIACVRNGCYLETTHQNQQET